MQQFRQPQQQLRPQPQVQEYRPQGQPQYRPQTSGGEGRPYSGYNERQGYQGGLASRYGAGASEHRPESEPSREGLGRANSQSERFAQHERYTTADMRPDHSRGDAIHAGSSKGSHERGDNAGNGRTHDDTHLRDSGSRTDDHTRLASGGRGDAHGKTGERNGGAAGYFGGGMAVDAPPGFGPARGMVLFIGEPPPEAPPAFRFSDTAPYRGDPDQLPGDPPPPGSD